MFQHLTAEQLAAQQSPQAHSATVMLAMQQLRPVAGRVSRNVVLFGNGGGTSVLAADAFGRVGLDVPALPEASRLALEALDLPLGTSVANPIDAPAMSLAREDGAVARRIVDGIFAHAHPDAFVIHMNVPVILGYSHADILGNVMDATVAAQARGATDAHVALVLRSDGEPEIERLKGEMRNRALEAGIPVYNELVDAARAIAGFGLRQTQPTAQKPIYGDLHYCHKSTSLSRITAVATK